MYNDCAFCKIISGQQNARVVYRNDDAIAFFPLEMNAKGHIIIAPTKHFTDLFNISESGLSSLMKTVSFLSKHCRHQLKANGVNIIHASGKAAQQSVFHFHFHLLPRFNDDKLNAWPELQKWSGELDELLVTMKV